MTANVSEIESLLNELQTIELDEATLPVSPLDADSVPQAFAILFDLLLHNPSQLALGWWILLITTVLIVAAGVMSVVIHRRNNRYRRMALKELNDLYRVCDQGEFLRSAAQLIKRLCMHHLHPSDAALYGSQWKQRLIALYPALPETTADLLCEGQYQARADFDSHVIFQDLARFIRAHQRNVPPC